MFEVLRSAGDTYWTYSIGLASFVLKESFLCKVDHGEGEQNSLLL